MKIIIDTSIVLHKSWNILSKPDFVNYGHDESSLFFGMINKVEDLFGNRDIIFSLDHYKPTWRHIKYQEYKKNRKEKTQEFINYKLFIEDKIKKSRYSYAVAEGYESDDIIASFIDWYPNEKILILTMDSDLFQLVQPNVSIIKPNKGGYSFVVDPINTVRSYRGMEAKTVLESKGVMSDQIIELKALAGDKGDNLVVPIPKLGEKRVIDLLNTYADLDGIFQATEETSIFDRFLYPQFREQIKENKDLIYLFKELVTLKKDVPKDCLCIK